MPTRDATGGPFGSREYGADDGAAVYDEELSGPRFLPALHQARKGGASIMEQPVLPDPQDQAVSIVSLCPRTYEKVPPNRRALTHTCDRSNGHTQPEHHCHCGTLWVAAPGQAKNYLLSPREGGS